MTPSRPRAPASSPISLPSGRPGRTPDPPETLDVVPQGPADVLPARVRLPLQHAAQRLRHAGPRAAGDALLRHLRTGVVSVASARGCK